MTEKAKAERNDVDFERAVNIANEASTFGFKDLENIAVLDAIANALRNVRAEGRAEQRDADRVLVIEEGGEAPRG